MLGRASAVSFLLYFLAWASLLSLPFFEQNVKQSEKSLMVNGAAPTISYESVHLPFNHKWIKSGLKSTLDSLGLETYEQQDDQGCGYLQGIVRSPRADGKESVILVTPISLLPSPSDSLLIRSGLVLSNHLSNTQWLAKDFIWLIISSSFNCTGSSILKAWLNQYQNGEGSSGLPRAGVLQQGLVLSSEDSKLGLSTMSINLVGHNGLLPKLDMLHLLRANSWLLARASVIDPTSDPSAPLTSLPSYLVRLQHMAHMIMQSTSCKATGAHAEFKRFMVDVATLHLTLTPTLTLGQLQESDAATLKLAEYLELVYRSFNNLSERMHHSYFLYLLTGPSTFVTVEFYIIPVILLILIPAAQVAASALELNSKTSFPGSKEIELYTWISSISCVLLASASSLLFWLLSFDALSTLLPVQSLAFTFASSLIPLAITKACMLLTLFDYPLHKLKLKVVALSLTVATLSALACINPWLSFSTSAFVVAPLSIGSASRSISAKYLRLISLGLSFPPFVSYLLQMVNQVSIGNVEAVTQAQLLLHGLCYPLWSLFFLTMPHHLN